MPATSNFCTTGIVTERLKLLHSARQSSAQYALDQKRLKRANLLVQSAFVACRFVLVNQAFSGHAVEYGHCRRVGCRCCRLVAGRNRCYDTLDVCAHHRPHTRIASASCFRLTSTFFRLGGVRQVSLLEKLKIQPNSIDRAIAVVNRFGVHSGRKVGVLPAPAMRWFRLFSPLQATAV